MKLIFSTVYGSHLFGCAVPGSDQDIKHIHLEDLQDLLFHDTHVIQMKTDDEEHGKIEEEQFSLRFYLHMLGKGQVIATDMFFSTQEYWRGEVHPLWHELKTLKPYIITKNIAPFASYAKSQAHKYGNKGTKLKTVQKAIELLEGQVEFREVAASLKGMEGVEYTTEHAAGGDIQHIKICGKSFGETTDYKLWLEPLRRVEKQYGERARLSQNGLDLKAQYHTVRICCEAIELLSTGNLTFPRPEAALLLKIRSGSMDEMALRSLVDSKLAELDSEMAMSTLPAKPNWEVINDFIYSAEKDYLKASLW